MVTVRKARKPAPSRHRETLAEKFERVLAEPIDAPFPKLTKREARYFLRRLAGSDPDAPSGEQVMRDFWGDWSEDEVSTE
jgi:hypothetical protein